MASKIYSKFKQLNAKADIDLDSANVWAALVMTNTTCDTQDSGIEFVGDFSTLDECDGANYVRKKLANKAVNLDAANARAEFDADDLSWTTLGNGTRQLLGVLLYVDADDDGAAGDDAANTAIAFVEFASTVDPGGGTFSLPWSAEGILQLT